MVDSDDLGKTGADGSCVAGLRDVIVDLEYVIDFAILSADDLPAATSFGITSVICHFDALYDIAIGEGLDVGGFLIHGEGLNMLRRRRGSGTGTGGSWNGGKSGSLCGGGMQEKGWGEGECEEECMGADTHKNSFVWEATPRGC